MNVQEIDGMTIVDIDGYIHVVNDKVVGFSPNDIDLSDETDIQELKTLVENLGNFDVLPLRYSKGDMLLLSCDDDMKSMQVETMEHLPYRIKKKIRSAIETFEIDLRVKNYFKDIDFDELAKSAIEVMESIQNGTYDFEANKPEHGLPPEEQLKRYFERGCIDEINYPGGPGQWVKDIQNGTYGKSCIPNEKSTWFTKILKLLKINK